MSAIRYSDVHWVEITETDDPDDPREFEIEHPDSCPVDTARHDWARGEILPETSRDCWVTHDLDGIGHAELFDGFPLGRTAFRQWGSGPDHFGEYDGGTEIVALEGDKP